MDEEAAQDEGNAPAKSQANGKLTSENKKRSFLLPGILLLLCVLLSTFFLWRIYSLKAAQARRDALRRTHIRSLGVTNEPLPLQLSREQRATLLLESLEKRIVGRRVSYREIERTAQEIGPIVEAAVQQPEVQSSLRRMAQGEGVSVDTMRSRWIELQEADLLLEAGGDPDSVSPANAVGAAQWLAGTAQGVGLKVDLKASQRFTVQIDELKRQIAWRVYLQRPDVELNAPGIPPLSPTQAAAELPALRQQLTNLQAQRRVVDERYDPRRAIFAQTRYLLRLYPRFPSADWLFQAYHGGEGGVKTLLKLYLGSRWHGNVADAIRYGAEGKPLHFEEVYFTTTPLQHTEAFRYLFGRSDDHRHYWWKLLASERALKQYRQDPAALRNQWKAFLPGRPTESLWYAPLVEDSLTTAADSTEALQLNEVREGTEFKFQPIAPELRATGHYATLRPQALGTLRLVEHLYRKCGGVGPLTVGDMTYTQDYLRAALKLQEERKVNPSGKTPQPLALPWPPDLDKKSLPGGGPAFDFDYHTIGVAFDMMQPSDERLRKILEFSLDTLGERKILTWRDSKDRGVRHYHVVPNPRFGDALQEYAGNNQKLPLPEF